MTRICILMQGIQTLGGVQRVISCMMNELVQDPDYEIYICHPFTRKGEELYHIDSRINQIDAKQFYCKNTAFKRILKKVNRNTRIFVKHPGFLQQLYYPQKQVEALREWVSLKKIDILVGAAPTYAILAGIVAAKLPGVKVIAWMHSTYKSYFHIKGHPEYSQQELFNLYAKYFDKMFVLTNSEKETFSRYTYGLRVEPEVFYNPITIRVRQQVTHAPNRLLYVGRINVENKGCDLLLKIVRRLKEKGTDFTVDVVGTGEYLDTLKRLSAEQGLENIMIFHGLSNHVEEFYEKATIQLVTSRCEGFGLIITEAMAHGVPVVAFHADGPDEIIQDGVSGCLIEQFDCDAYANKIVELLSSPSKLQEMSTHALLRANDFSLTAAVESFKKHITECMN